MNKMANTLKELSNEIVDAIHGDGCCDHCDNVFLEPKAEAIVKNAIEEYLADNAEIRVIAKMKCILFVENLDGCPYLAKYETICQDSTDLELELKIFDNDPKYFDTQLYKATILLEELKDE